MNKLLALVLGCCALAVSAADYSQWAKVQLLSFEQYGGAELTNFPVLVALESGVNGFSYDEVKADGSDLRFVDLATGDELAYEFDTWNVSGRSLVWVRIPILNSSTRMTMYLGNPEAPKMPYTSDGSTWANGYIAVWHMNVKNGTTVDDSTANKHTLTAVGASFTTSNSPYGSTAVYSAGASKQLLRTPHASDFNGLTAMTIEAWATDEAVTTDGTSAARALIGKRSSGADTAFAFFRYGSLYNFMLDLTQSNSDNHRITFEKSKPTTAFAYHATTFDGAEPSASRSSFFRDGVFLANGTAAGTIPTAVSENTQPVVVFGLDSGTTTPWKGVVDEMRLSNVARSADWLAASHKALRNELLVYAPIVINGTLELNLVEVANCVSNTVTLSAALAGIGAGTVEVRLFYGTEPDNLSQFKDCGTYYSLGDSIVTTLEGLLFDTTYYFQFHADDGSQTFDTATDSVTTASGGVLFDSPTYILNGNAVELSVRVAQAGYLPATIEAFLSTDPEDFGTPVRTWTGITTSQRLTCTADNLLNDTTYYYFFRGTSTMPAPDGRTLAADSLINSIPFRVGYTMTWQAVDNGLWNNAANWDAGTVPARPDTVIFNTNPAQEARTVLMQSEAEAMHVHFEADAGSYTVGDGSKTLILNKGGSIANTSAAQQTIHTPLKLLGDITLDGSSPSTTSPLVLTGTVTPLGSVDSCLISLTGSGLATNTLQGSMTDIAVNAPFSLSKEGPGIWLLSGTNVCQGDLAVNAGTLWLGGENTFGGNITLNSGTLGLLDNTALGQSTLTINGGTLGMMSGFQAAYNTPHIWNGDFALYFFNNQSQGSSLGTGPITLNNAVGITTQSGYDNNSLRLNGTITAANASARLSILGAAGSSHPRIYFGGANSLIGGVCVSNASVAVYNEQCFAGGPLILCNANITMASGTLALRGLTDVAIQEYIGLDLGVNNKLSFGKTPIKTSGNTTIFSANSSELILDSVITPTASNSGNELILRQSASGGSGTTLFHLANTNNVKRLRVRAGTPAATTADFSFDHPYAWGIDEVYIESQTSGLGLPTINNRCADGHYVIPTTNRFVWALSFIFGTASTHDLTLAHGSVRLSTNVMVNVQQPDRTLTVHVPISDATAIARELSKSGAGTLVLGGANTYSGGTLVTNGTLRLTSAQALAGGKITIKAPGKVDIPEGLAVPISELVIEETTYSHPGATYKSTRFPGYITGSGSLSIPGPKPAVFSIY